MRASDDTVLHHTLQEGCRKSGSSNDSPTELNKSTNKSQESNCSKCSSQSGSAQFTDSTAFHISLDNASRTAVKGSKDSICGTSQDYCEDFHLDSFETYTREGPGSFTISWVQQLETKEWTLPKNKKKNDVHTKGGKTLPKKKPQQKTIFTTDHTTNVQGKNNIACRLLSAKDHEIKELKNEVAVLQNKLETFAMENKTLKHLQSQHLKVIKNYENAEINLPELLTMQSKEMQALKEHFRKSQEEERRASKKLRDVEVQLFKTKDALQALKKICEDKKLEERGELQRKLKLLTQKLEASDKRTQDLEKQMSLKTASFRHQLAVEKKKTNEAQSITANLQVEIEKLKLKLKEKERELGITNIYAHRMRKGLPEKADSCSSPRGPLVNPKLTCRRPRNRQQSEKDDFIGDSVTNYEPSHARFPKERQKDTSSTPLEENSRIPPGGKKLLFPKLFGPNRILNTK